jgi:hypothetical protein
VNSDDDPVIKKIIKFNKNEFNEGLFYFILLRIMNELYYLSNSRNNKIILLYFNILLFKIEVNLH